VAEAFAPIERRKVYEQVSERLEAELGTTLKAGDALPPERELAERYGVGRSSVREALRMLESRGLIESRGSGTFVVAAWRNPFQAPLSVVVAGENVDRTQLFEVRRMLEAEAAALAAMRRTIDQMNEMHEATDDMEIELARADRFIAADIRYHLVIAEATGNRLLLRLMEAIRDGLTETFETVFKFPGGPERSIEQHRLINDAIEAEDPQRARQLMTEHILRVEQELAQIDD
jgi:GntR family transcriptional regulator, transcriptional repressor for pyruvate dehydrogenase complex